MASAYRSCVLAAPTDQIWPTIRNFNGLPDWHPVVTASRIEGGGAADQVGCVRAITLKDGGVIRERLLALSDYDFSCTYSILESPMAVENYIATLKLTPVTDGDRTFIEWSAEFGCATDNETGLVALIADGIFQSSFDALKTRFGG